MNYSITNLLVNKYISIVKNSGELQYLNLFNNNKHYISIAVLVLFEVVKMINNIIYLLFIKKINMCNEIICI